MKKVVPPKAKRALKAASARRTRRADAAVARRVRRATDIDTDTDTGFADKVRKDLIRNFW